MKERQSGIVQTGRLAVEIPQSCAVCRHYAPQDNPKYAVAVLLVEHGGGGSRGGGADRQQTVVVPEAR